MGTVSKTAAGLRFFGDDLDPDEITFKLGRKPTVGVTKGGTWHTEMGAAKIAKTGSWRLTVSELSPGNLDAQVCMILEQLSDDLEIWSDLTTRFKSDIFTGLWLDFYNEGIDLSPKTLANLGARGLMLDLDIYYTGEERAED